MVHVHKYGSGGEKITECYDFYAVAAQLLFSFHDFIEPVGSTDETNSSQEVTLYRARKKWEGKDPSSKEMATMICLIYKSLKDLLSNLNEKGWTLSPNVIFKEHLDKC